VLAEAGPRSHAPAEVYPGRAAAQHLSRYAKWLAHAERRPRRLWHGADRADAPSLKLAARGLARAPDFAIVVAAE